MLRVDEYHLPKLGLGGVPLTLRLIEIPGTVFLESGPLGPMFEH